jgi:hypothetical protein
VKTTGVTRTILGLCAALAALSLSTSCTDSTLESTAFLPPRAGLPLVPTDMGPERNSAALTVGTATDGGRVYNCSNGSRVDGRSLVVTSIKGGTEWAMYAAKAPQPGPLDLQVDLKPLSGGNVWIAVANFKARAWEYSGPFPTGKVGRIPIDPARNVSAAGSIYYLVIAFDGTRTRVLSSSINAPLTAKPQ